MSDDEKPTGLPLFFQQIAVLDADRHRDLRLDRGRDYLFARASNAVPLALHELPAACGDYPIVFAAKAQKAVLAIVGYRERENLFIEPGGGWRRGAYLPAYVRNYPFAFIEPPGGAQLVLGIDPRARSLRGGGGAPLFVDRQPAPALKEAMDLCKSLYQSLRETTEFCTALDEAGLLVENQAVIEFARGGMASLGGFRVIDADKFAALDDAKFLDWRRRGWLASIYAHFHSAGRWSRIVDLAAAAKPAEPAS